MLSNLSTEQKVGQLFCIGIAGPELDAATLELLAEVQPGGVCLFARNIKSARQTRDLLDGLREVMPVTPILSVDQEGGTVDRLRRLVTPMGPAGKVRTREQAKLMGEIVARLLRVIGFNMDFAPVVDVVDEQRAAASNGLFTRPFGRTKEQVTELAGAFLSGLQEGGIAGCLKHFPGLGGADVDSHEELPQIRISAAEFDGVDLYPYRALSELDVRAVMVAHACYPNTTLQEKGPDGKLLPSSLSASVVMGLLRSQLGFDGVAFTDDLEMGAILRGFGIDEACRLAVDAGEDVLAICADPENVRAGYRAVLSSYAAGEITDHRIEESLTRIEVLKQSLAEPLPFDEARVEAISHQIADFNAGLEII